MNTLVDYEFSWGLSIEDAVKRYNECHGEPANMVWVCREEYEELMAGRKKNGVGVGWNPCSRERGNVMVGRLV